MRMFGHSNAIAAAILLAAASLGSTKPADAGGVTALARGAPLIAAAAPSGVIDVHGRGYHRSYHRGYRRGYRHHPRRWRHGGRGRARVRIIERPCVTRIVRTTRRVKVVRVIRHCGPYGHHRRHRRY